MVYARAFLPTRLRPSLRLTQAAFGIAEAGQTHERKIWYQDVCIHNVNIDANKLVLQRQDPGHHTYAFLPGNDETVHTLTFLRMTSFRLHQSALWWPREHSRGSRGTSSVGVWLPGRVPAMLPGLSAAFGSRSGVGAERCGISSPTPKTALAEGGGGTDRDGCTFVLQALCAGTKTMMQRGQSNRDSHFP